jgi:anti-anti-sigma factor
MDAPPSSVTAARDGQCCVVTISGDLDLTRAAAFPQMVIQAVSAQDGHGEQVVLDLSGLAFLDVAGARALVAAIHAMAKGHPVTVRSISPTATRVLSLLGVADPGFPNLEKAEPTGLPLAAVFPGAHSLSVLD